MSDYEGVQEPLIALVERVPEDVWPIRLPPFQAIDECPKCGDPSLKTEYHEGIHLASPCGKMFAVQAQKNDWKFPEHLCRTCPRCRHGWPEQVQLRG